MSGRLAGETAIVTGAGRGFGRAIALRLAAEGAAVTVASRNRRELDAVVAEITKTGGRALAAPGDVTVSKDVARVVAAAGQEFGAVSVLVSNAGVPGPFGPIWSVDAQAWWAAQAVHVRAPFLFLQQLMPGMVERRRGCVIAICATASRIVAAHLSAYCVGKTAQARVIAQAAAEAREHGVSLFAMDPGFVFTDLAAETMNSPDAQRWLPGMVARLREKEVEPDKEAVFARCAGRCVDLAGGQYAALSGRYFEMSDDLEVLLAEASAAPARSP
ncbi:MAG TPA: SDR family NAD(P)-dependent oxidoreductase [Steroidobacteraceae bacterium]|nr:SDR family NAD(P)-dependent oxidoreductase [Steroidobacteraceae bacterium]